jgi:hypothetical protein
LRGLRDCEAREETDRSSEGGRVGTSREECRELGRGLDHLLEIVEQEQHLPFADVLGEPVLGTEGLRDRLRDEGRVPERREPDPEDARLELGDERSGRLEREPRLAGAAGGR